MGDLRHNIFAIAESNIHGDVANSVTPAPSYAFLTDNSEWLWCQFNLASESTGQSRSELRESSGEVPLPALANQMVSLCQYKAGENTRARQALRCCPCCQARTQLMNEYS